MNRKTLHTPWTGRSRQLFPALLSALALALIIPQISLAQAPDGNLSNGKPLVAEPPPPPKKRGRPPKPKPVEVAPPEPKKRGRPPKAAAAAPSKKK